LLSITECLFERLFSVERPLRCTPIGNPPYDIAVDVCAKKTA
jgi:hypothetical protein